MATAVAWPFASASARIGDAEPNEMWASSKVNDLVAGSGIDSDKRGEHA